MFYLSISIFIPISSLVLLMLLFLHLPIVKLSSWGLVYYNNLLALMFFPVGALFTQQPRSNSSTEVRTGTLEIIAELFTLKHGIENDYSSDAYTVTSSLTSIWNSVFFPVAVSCVFGVMISFFAMACRKELSATTFTGKKNYC